MEIKNRSAYFEFFIDDKYVAGIVLTGTEVKSLRDGKANFNDSYCVFVKGGTLDPFFSYCRIFARHREQP